MAGALGAELAGADGVAEADELAPVDPVEADDDDPVEPVVDVVVVLVLVCVVLVVDTGAAVEVGTVNGGTADVSAVVEPLPQATRPTASAAPLSRATANFRVLVRLLGTIRRGEDPFAFRNAGSR